MPKKAARFVYRILFYEWESSSSFHAVRVGEFAHEQNCLFAGDDKSAVREFRRGAFVFFDDERAVVRDGFSRNAFIRAVNVHVRAFGFYAVKSFDVRNFHRSRPYDALALFNRFVAERIGVNLERRNGFHRYIAFVNVSSVHFAEQFARVRVPPHEVKSRSARFAPARRL